MHSYSKYFLILLSSAIYSRLPAFPENSRELDLNLIARTISSAMQKSPFDRPVGIALNEGRQAELNAYVRADGSISISSGLASMLKAQAQSSLEFEAFLAAVIAHEMGHYYNGHGQSPLTVSGNASANLEEARQREFQADQFASLALKRSGYPSSALPRVIQMISQNQSENPYLSTHPSGNARLARISPDNRAYYSKLAELELALSAIEAGGEERLRQAQNFLKRELAEQPANEYLKLALARIYHRRWESSCSLEQLMFKTSIAPLQKDIVPLALPERIKASSWHIPGNLAHYRAAVQAYRQIKARDAATESALGALLSYDPDAKGKALQEIQAGLNQASEASLNDRWIIYNNLGVLYYKTGEVKNAGQMFARAAEGRSQALRSLWNTNPALASSMLKEERKLQQTDPLNSGIWFAPAFNLGQFYYLTGEPAMARKIWQQYVTEYDRKSDWFRYASRKLGQIQSAAK